MGFGASSVQQIERRDGVEQGVVEGEQERQALHHRALSRVDGHRLSARTLGWNAVVANRTSTRRVSSKPPIAAPLRPMPRETS